MGTAPCCTTSSTWVAGANSPAARGVITNFPEVSLPTMSAKSCALPNRMSTDGGQLVAISHFSSGNAASWAVACWTSCAGLVGGEASRQLARSVGATADHDDDLGDLDTVKMLIDQCGKQRQDRCLMVVGDYADAAAQLGRRTARRIGLR